MLTKCDQCKKEVTSKQIIKVVWKQKNKTMLLCPVCMSEFYNWYTKQMQIPDHMLKMIDPRDKGSLNLLKHKINIWSQKIRSSM